METDLKLQIPKIKNQGPFDEGVLDMHKIIIYISHRLDNLDLFDQFIKIEKGHIVLNQRRNN